MQLTEILELLRSIDGRLARIEGTVRGVAHPGAHIPTVDSSAIYNAAAHSTGASERRVPRYGPADQPTTSELLAERARKLPGGP